MSYEEVMKLYRQIFDDPTFNPNFRFLGKEEQFQKRAEETWSRISSEKRDWIVGKWYGLFQPKTAEEEEKYKILVEDFKRLRLMAQTNLFFLCKVLVKYKSVTTGAHEEICNKFFVQKEPWLSLEEFAAAYDPSKHERLLLVPRGGFKSSIDIADCTQWIICHPEVTILILTGVYDLAKDFVGELRQHFTEQETGDPKNPSYVPRKLADNEPSMFQMLFPEHCVQGEGKATEFQTPACSVPDKEPNVRAASIEQSLSGWHFWVMKLDDVVTNENSQTLTRLAAVNKQVDINKAMLHPTGFLDKIGTWYDESDTYGLDIKMLEDQKKNGEEPSVIMFFRAAFWLTEEALKAGKVLTKNIAQEDVELWFPERLSYEFLIRKWKNDQTNTFPIKYLNNPKMVHEVKFPRELLLRQTINANMLPPTGVIVSVWDTAYSVKKWADFTVGITAIIYGGRFHIIDMVRGRYNEYELPAVIAATAHKWKPKRIAIEDSMGVKWMGRELRREMDKLHITVPVEYISLGLGNKAKAKEIKAKPVVRLLGDSRMFFSKGCQGLEELYTELEKFGQVDTHDDIVSALSLLTEVFAGYADMDARTQFINQDWVRDQKEKAMHDMIYLDGPKWASLRNEAIAELPEQSRQPIAQSFDRDPFEDLLG